MMMMRRRMMMTYIVNSEDICITVFAEIVYGCKNPHESEEPFKKKNTWFLWWKEQIHKYVHFPCVFVILSSRVWGVHCAPMCWIPGRMLIMVLIVHSSSPSSMAQTWSTYGPTLFFMFRFFNIIKPSSIHLDLFNHHFYRPCRSILGVSLLMINN